MGLIPARYICILLRKGVWSDHDLNINLNLSASRHSLNRSHQFMSPQLNRSGYPSSGEGEEQAVKSGDEEMRALDSAGSGGRGTSHSGSSNSQIMASRRQ